MLQIVASLTIFTYDRNSFIIQPIGQMFVLVELTLLLKMYLLGGLAPSSQTVGSLLIPLASFADQKKDLILSPVDSVNFKI